MGKAVTSVAFRGAPQARLVGYGLCLSDPAGVTMRTSTGDSKPTGGARAAGGLLSGFSRVTSSGRFIPEIDGLRFIAIGTVVLYHVAANLEVKNPGSYTLPGPDEWVGAVVGQGFRGVSLFFIISGFILALPFVTWRQAGGAPVRMRQYFLRRLTRLEPPYVLCMLLFALLRLVTHHEAGADTLRRLGASLTYSHNLVYGEHSVINNVAWSLEIEVQFYTLLPLIALAFAIRGHLRRRLLLAGLGLAAIAAHVFVLDADPRLRLTVLNYLHFFLGGLLLADVFVLSWRGAPTRSLRWDLVSLVGWPALVWLWRTPDPLGIVSGSGDDTLLAAVLFPPLAVLLYGAVFRGPVTNRIMTNPWITTVGGMCYTIYLLHNPVLSAAAGVTKGFVPTGSYALNLLAQFVIVLPGLLVASAAYFAVVERPCMARDWPQRAWARIRRGVAGLRAVSPRPAPAE